MADVSVQNERINGWIPSSATNVILNWPERIKTQPHDDRDNCFLPFDSKGPCGMTVNNDIDDDSATKHGDSHTVIHVPQVAKPPCFCNECRGSSAPVKPEGAPSSCRLRRLKMTPQLCRCRLVSQTSSSFVGFGVFFSGWSVSSVSRLPVLTADLRGASWAPVGRLRHFHTTAFVEGVHVDRTRFRSYSKTAVGEQAVDFRLGSRVGSRVRWMLC